MNKTERYILTSALSIILAPKLDALGIAKSDQATVIAAAAIAGPAIYHVIASCLERLAARRNPPTPAPVPASSPASTQPGVQK